MSKFIVTYADPTINDWYKSGGFPPGTFKNSEIEVSKAEADEVRRVLIESLKKREPLVYGRDWDYTPFGPERTIEVTADSCSVKDGTAYFYRNPVINAPVRAGIVQGGNEFVAAIAHVITVFRKDDGAGGSTSFGPVTAGGGGGGMYSVNQLRTEEGLKVVGKSGEIDPASFLASVIEMQRHSTETLKEIERIAAEKAKAEAEITIKRLIIRYVDPDNGQVKKYGMLLDLDKIEKPEICVDLRDATAKACTCGPEYDKQYGHRSTCPRFNLEDL